MSKSFLPSSVRRVLGRIQRGLRIDLLCFVLPHRLGIDILERGSVAQLVYFNPCATRYVIRRWGHAARLIKPRRFLLRGAWDDEFVDRIGPDYLHTTIREMWVDGRQYRDTEEYAVMSRAVDAYIKGECDAPERLNAHWCRSHSDIDQYFQMLTDCYEDIRTNGYRTQVELAKEDPTRARVSNDEITIAINREGEAVFLGLQANHRFSILRHLGITRAPAVLIGVSDLWAKKKVVTRGSGRKSLVRHMLTEAQATLDRAGA
jgi:hypothetical protein